MKNVIITGSTGLLGTALKQEMDNDGLSYSEYKRKILGDLSIPRNIKTYINTIKQTKPETDTLIHCAAKVGGVLANMNDNDGFFKENVAINNNVLQTALDNDIENLVSILSTCIFPNDNITYPLTVDQLDNGAPHNSNPGYSYAKRLLYYQTKMYRNYTGKNWISVIPTNIYGKNDNFNLESSHLIPALIRKAYEASKTGNNFVVWGDGTPLRQFIYSKDLSEQILWAIENWKSDKPFMAINETEYAISDIANIIADRFGLLNKIVFDKTKPNGQSRKPAKTDVIDYKFTPLEEGLNETIDWFIKNYKNIRK